MNTANIKNHTNVILGVKTRKNASVIKIVAKEINMPKYTCVTCGEKINNREEIGNHRKKCSGALGGDLEDD